MRNANGMGTIYKGNGKRRKPYIVVSGAKKDSNGKYIRVYIGAAATLREANKMLMDYNARKGNIEYKDIQLIHLLEKWKESKHYNSIKTEETKEKYLSSFKRIFEPILTQKFIDLSYLDYQSLLDKFSKFSGKQALVILKSIYLDALKNEIVSRDISALLEASNFVTREVKRTVFKDYFVKYLWNKYNENNSEIYAAILILFYSGMRSIDLRRIENKNIFLEKRYLITGSKTKAGLNRKIPIHDLIYPIIDKFKNEEKFLFNDLKYTDLISTFQKIATEYDNNLIGNLHSIRHTFITKMQRLQIKVSIVRNIVGHKESNVTDGVYTHWEIEDLLEAINKLKY